MATVPRAMNGTELAQVRLDGQHSKLYLSVFNPVVMGAGQLDADLATDDKVVVVTIDNWAYQNSYTEIPADFTCYVGSAAGLYDKGMVRCRGTHGPGALTQINLGETSEINWAENDHVTIVDEVNMWPRHLRLVSLTEIYMDYNNAFGTQHADPDPVPVLGPTFTPVWMAGATVDVTFDGSSSWSLEGSIDGYTWTAPGASATTGLATATPTITYNAAGTYRVSCTVSCDNGKTYIGHRWVKVHTLASPPITDFIMESCTGSWDTGGWVARVTLFDNATQTDIRDRALVCLFTDDWYGGTEVSHGYIDDREQILMQGWVDGESIDWDLEQGTVSFDVNGPQWWLQNQQGFPAGLRSTSGASTSWIEMQTLTPKKGAWQFFHWRTTMTRMLDVAIINDSREVALFDAAGGTLWNQINDQVYAMVFSRLCADRYGRVWMGFESNLIPVGDRGFIPTVQAVTTADWRRPLTIDRNPVPRVALVDLSGVAYVVATPGATSLFSLAPGHVPKNHGGSIERYDRLALTDQAESNELAGLMLGWRNNEYPSVTIPFASNHRHVDVTPHMFLTLALSAGDTERGLSGTLTLIPRTVSYAYDLETGQLLCDVTAEGDTDDTGITTLIGDPPPTVPPPGGPPDPDPLPWNPLPDTDPLWPSGAYFAPIGSVTGEGVYKTTSWTGPDDATQPSWEVLAVTGDWPGDNLLRSFGMDKAAPGTYVYALCQTTRNLIRYNGSTWDTILSDATVKGLYGADAKIEDFMLDTETGYGGVVILTNVAAYDASHVFGRCTNMSGGASWSYVQSTTYWQRNSGNLYHHNDIMTYTWTWDLTTYDQGLTVSTAGGAMVRSSLLASNNTICTHFKTAAGNILNSHSNTDNMYRFAIGGANGTNTEVLSAAVPVDAWRRRDYPGTPQGQICHVNHETASYLRFIPNIGTLVGHLLTSTDDYDTYTDHGRVDIGEISVGVNRAVVTFCGVVSDDDEEMIVYGSFDMVAGNPHPIHAGYENTDLSPVTKGGTNPVAGVSSNSILYTAGGPTNRGIQLWEA